MILQKIKRKNLLFNVRPNTMDEWVVDEVLNPNTYLKHLNIQPKDVVLDIGANIGAFSLLALKLGAEVYSFEPDEDNFNIAKENIRKNKLESRSVIHKNGISNRAKDVKFYLNGKRNMGMHSVIPVQGREFTEIKCIGIQKVLNSAKFTVMKIDCEGEEYKILRSITNFGRIDRIRFEWHRSLLKDKSNDKLTEVINHLETHNFMVKVKRDAVSPVQMVSAYRLRCNLENRS
jgi:FkbM family methyltransferase